MMDLKPALQALKPVTGFLTRNSPRILLATGLSGVVTAVVMGIRSGAEVHEVMGHHARIRERIMEGDGEEKKAAIRDTYLREAKELAVILWPTATVTALSVACILGSSRIQAKRGAAALAAYSVANRSLEAYMERAREELGDDLHKEIMQSVSDKLAEEDDVPFDEDYSYRVGDDGLTVFKDCISGRYFRSTVEKVRQAESTINKRLLAEARVPLREFYYELGIEDDLVIGEGLGWEAIRSPLEVYFTTIHPGSPMEHLYMHYHVAPIDVRALERW